MRQRGAEIGQNQDRLRAGLQVLAIEAYRFADAPGLVLSDCVPENRLGLLLRYRGDRAQCEHQSETAHRVPESEAHEQGLKITLQQMGPTAQK